MGVLHHIRLHHSLMLAVNYVKAVVAQPLKALTVILSVCNNPATITKSQLSQVMNKGGGVFLPQRENLPDMFTHCSNGKASFHTDIYDDIVNIPCYENLHYNCLYQQWAEYADRYMARTSNISLDKYPYHIYVLPRDMCNFGGQGALPPCYPYCRVWIEGGLAYEVAVYFHELGHNLGLNHARYETVEYGDLSDTMGYCCNVRCLNAAHSFQLNWSKPRNIYVIKPNTSFKEKLELKGNEYVVINHIYSLQSNTYFLQYRKRDEKYNKEIPYPFGNCLNLYQVYQHRPGHTHLRMTLCKKFQKWKDEASGLSIILISLTDKTVLVRITNM